MRKGRRSSVNRKGLVGYLGTSDQGVRVHRVERQAWRDGHTLAISYGQAVVTSSNEHEYHNKKSILVTIGEMAYTHCIADAFLFQEHATLSMYA